jgi:hypothetical protein
LLIAQQFLERISRFDLAGKILRRRYKLAPGHLEVFAVICKVLFGDGVSAAIATLVGDPGIVACTIQADFEV